MFQALLYLVVGLAFGAHFEAGIGRVPRPARALVSMVWVGFGAIGLIMAIRTGYGEAVQGMFPLHVRAALLQLGPCRAT